jgi:hypothetical protein
LQGFFIGPTEFAYLAHLTDLRAVGFDGSPFPRILGKEGSINADLRSEKAHHVGSHLLPGAGKAAFVLQTLE